MKIRYRYEKRGNARYISHLDTMRVFERALRRLRAPVAFSEGFNPHMKMSLSNPLPLGVESCAEFLELKMDKEVDRERLLIDLNGELPLGLRIISSKDGEGESINNRIYWSTYDIIFYEDYFMLDGLEDKIKRFLSQKSIIIEKKKKKKGKKTLTNQDIRTMIGAVDIKEYDSERIVISANLYTSGQGGLNVLVFVKILNDFLGISKDDKEIEVLRRDILDENLNSLL